LYSPPIATISRDIVGMGRSAAQLLHARLQQPQERATILLPTTYLPRASASPPPKR
jgi:DNA-binding LacI/PurR family transcriptional regulator